MSHDVPVKEYVLIMIVLLGLLIWQTLCQEY
jgi:hypothetical protein